MNVLVRDVLSCMMLVGVLFAFRCVFFEHNTKEAHET